MLALIVILSAMVTTACILTLLTSERFTYKALATGALLTLILPVLFFFGYVTYLSYPKPPHQMRLTSISPDQRHEVFLYDSVLCPDDHLGIYLRSHQPALLPVDRRLGSLPGGNPKLPARLQVRWSPDSQAFSICLDHIPLFAYDLQAREKISPGASVALARSY